MSIELTWLSSFLDLPAATEVVQRKFWAEVTGYEVSEPRGDAGEFTTLLPVDGEEYLRVQRTGDLRPKIHLDLHVSDPRAAAEVAKALGATEVADLGYVVLASPGGLLFCLVTHAAVQVPSPARWPEGHVSRVYQATVDIPSERYDSESRFWASLLDAELETIERRREYRLLRSRSAVALRLLLQRLDESHGQVRAHLDVGTDDRVAETSRHWQLGANVVGVHDFWTVLSDPGGLV